MPTQPQRLIRIGEDDFFLPLGKADHRRRPLAELVERLKSGTHLPFSSINQKKIGRRPILDSFSPKSSQNDLPNRCEIIHSFDGLDLESSIPRLEGNTVEKRDEAGDGIFTSKMRDVDSFD